MDSVQQETDLVLSIINFYRNVMFTDSYQVANYAWKYVKGTAQSRKQTDVLCLVK